MSKKLSEFEELLSRGVADVVVHKDFEKLLKSGKKLRIYFGIDPTSTNIHLGHAIPLRKLREFQDLGHEIILLVGSFTAQIGDPTDREAMRVPLTEKEVKENFKTYKKQAAKILDFKKTKVVYNGNWLGHLQFGDVVRLAQNFTVQQMIERDMYQKRMKEGKPIGLHEFLYPLMQGYDSVYLEVDLEIGGNDQLFNMLAGRTLLKLMKKKEKHVLTTVLLPGLDGRKMSKTYGNTVNVMDTPAEMFGKIMSLHDDLILQYFELCTNLPDTEIQKISSELKAGNNPRDAKARLAREIVTIYHDEKAAVKAEQEFNQVFQKKERPDNITKKKIKAGKKKMDELLVELGLAASKSEAKRLVLQGGVKINDETVKEWNKETELQSGTVVQVGKRKFVEITH